ncbi:MAG: LysM peptidoglycan-binding domain-containing protein [Pirellulales bacterium]
MSSIRPLATIALLAIAGVYLYFKINETQPQLPADVANWTLPVEVEIEEQPIAPAYGTTTPTGMAVGVSNGVPSGPQPGSISGNSSYPPLPAVPPASRVQSTAIGPPIMAREAMVTPAIPQEVADGAAVVDNFNSEPTTSQVLPPSTPPSASSSPVSPTPQTSLFGATRLSVQGALDRGELSQALLLLSDWYGDPSLAPEEIEEVNSLLSQLAGSVIYSTEHRLVSPYVVKAGDHLEDIAKQYQVPWKLLAKINGIDRPNQLQPGQELKVLRGPFSALIDLDDRKMTIMLARRYAGKFAIDIDPQVTVEEGQWKVEQKLVTPGSLNLGSSVSATTPVGQIASSSVAQRALRATEEQSLILTKLSSENSQIAVLRGPGTVSPGVSTEPENRVIRLSANDVENVFDILSVGSNVIIRR